MKKLSLLGLLILSGCHQSGVGIIPNNNNKVEVVVLFTDEDGHSVKRFYDGGNYHYYVTPTGSTISKKNKKFETINTN